jgi:hypothetical protein
MFLSLFGGIAIYLAAGDPFMEHVLSTIKFGGYYFSEILNNPKTDILYSFS